MSSIKSYANLPNFKSNFVGKPVPQPPGTKFLIGNPLSIPAGAKTFVGKPLPQPPGALSFLA